MKEITPRMVQAWEMEHEAIFMPPLARGYYQNAARELRLQDIHEALERMDERSKAQNEIIDIGLELAKQGKQVPIFET